MKKHLILILLIILLALVCEIHGFKRGFVQGQKATNSWWIDRKSRLYDTRETLRKETRNGFNKV
ncbi:MAG: hypothetical protein M0036_23790 [Desulfobacteraceae bacterium]|nr:hypothetical protein [Desulfobacteraceae bacterium]